MIFRAFATLAAIAIPLLLTIGPVADRLPDFAWLGPALAAAAALPVVFAARNARGQALVGAALAAMAAAASPALPAMLAFTGDPESVPVHDLRDGPLPAEAEGYVAVRGYLRGDWQVDEYRVAPGERPDQNERANAVLVPLLGTQAEVIEVEGGELGRVIVVRVEPDVLRFGDGWRTLRGRLEPVAPEIVDSLFAVQIDAQGQAHTSALRPDAVLLDTFDAPTRGQAITRLCLAIGAALLSLILLVLSLPRAEAGKPK